MEFRLPDLGEDAGKSAKVSFWYSSENDKVEEGQSFIDHLNPDSLQTIAAAQVEPFLKETTALTRYQFERIGYFCTDPDSSLDHLVFNKTVGLRDSWAKMQKQQKKKA